MEIEEGNPLCGKILQALGFSYIAGNPKRQKYAPTR